MTMNAIKDESSEIRLRDLASDCWKHALEAAEREVVALKRERARTAQQIRHALGSVDSLL
jgi:hypothetical protein